MQREETERELEKMKAEMGKDDNGQTRNDKNRTGELNKRRAKWEKRKLRGKDSLGVLTNMPIILP